MEADIHSLYESDFYRILNFKCRCRDCQTSKPEYSETFTISFVRTGNFLFNVFRNSFDSYSGCVLVTKPGYERTVRHIHEVPDECTIIDFKNEFYVQLLEKYPSIKFLFDADLHSTLVKINPDTEYYHHRILKAVDSNSHSRLEIDSLIIDLVNIVFGKITDYEPDFETFSRVKKNHLVTIERAKLYMTDKFQEDISLMDIAKNCFVSPFHFSRIFKSLTFYSPHQFLQAIRLRHAAVLLRNTTISVMEVGFQSGFNSTEYFTAAFKREFGIPPSKLRTTEPYGVAS